MSSDFKFYDPDQFNSVDEVIELRSKTFDKAKKLELLRIEKNVASRATKKHYRREDFSSEEEVMNEMIRLIEEAHQGPKHPIDKNSSYSEVINSVPDDIHEKLMELEYILKNAEVLKVGVDL